MTSDGGRGSGPHLPGDFLSRRGRPTGLPIVFEVDRELSAQDLIDFASLSSVPVAPPSLKSIRSIHHAAARYVAQGKSHVEVGLLVGRTAQRIGDLCRDPAFKHLVSTYEAVEAQAFYEDSVRIQAKLTDIGEQASDEIIERLEDDETRKKIPIAELRQLAALGLDRTVAPPKTAVPSQSLPAQITFKIGTRNLDPEARRVPDLKVIEHVPDPDSSEDS